MRRVYLFLFFSIVLHLLIWVGVPRFEQKVGVRADRIFLEFKSAGRAGVGHALEEEKNLRRKARRQKVLMQRRLDARVQGILRHSVTKLAEFNLSESELGVADEEVYRQGVSSALFARSKLLPLVWKQIRAHVGYRPEHFRSRIEGDVSIRVRIDKFGKLIRIMDEEATGNRYLQGWVILCLMQALSEPFLDEPLDSNQMLTLQFEFSLGRAVHEAVVHSQHMIFPIMGDIQTGGLLAGSVPILKINDSPNDLTHEISLLKISTARIKNVFEDKTVKNQLEWSFYDREEMFLHNCEVLKNSDACGELGKLYTKVGKSSKAQHFIDKAKKSVQ